MWRFYNPNPRGRSPSTDCAIRAVAKATNRTWEESYILISLLGFLTGDVPDNNQIWGEHLRRLGFRLFRLPDTCPDCYTVRDFCRDFPEGTYIIGTGTHAVAVVDGDYYDAWDSGEETAAYVWIKGIKGD